jgi:Rps23 Pro-64 3,4-dihydroxylase Tpa1-like proline 4-hydroxylase
VSFLIDDFLNPAVRRAVAELAGRFQSARPFRHIVIDDFLTAGFCDRLLEQFPVFDDAHAVDENERVGGKATREQVRSLGEAYVDIDDLMRHPDFLSLLGRITGVKDLHYDPHYFGGGTHESSQGQELDPHIDFNYHPISREHRRLNLIIYLNPEWEDGWGGSLQLHRDPYREPELDEIVTVTPLLNRCVIFETSEHSWHGFQAIDLPAGRHTLSRKSFAVYFYTDTRPVDETAEEHSTVYVERHLSPSFQPGRVLNTEDVEKIKNLLQRRDQHLRRLYGDIQKLYGQLNRTRLRFGAAVDPMDPVEDLSMEDGSAQRMIGVLRSRIAELEASTSWRLTAPLRALKRLLPGKGRRGGK